MATDKLSTKISAYTRRFIYVVEDTEKAAYKVGVTKDLIGRLRHLQIASSSLLVMIGCWPGTREDEDAIHCDLAEYQKRSEWFCAPLERIVWAVSRQCGIPADEILADIESGVRRKTCDDPIQRRVRHKPSRATSTPAPDKTNNGSPVETDPHFYFESVADSESLAWFIPRKGMLKKRWICLGRVSANVLRDAQAKRRWLDEQIQSRALVFYEPDAPFREWLAIEDGQPV